MNNISEKLIKRECKRRIFVGCLASYNNGIIYGNWLDLSAYCDLEELQEDVNKILASSPYRGDEYDIQDCEGFGDFFEKDIYPSLSEAWEIHEVLLEVEKQGIDKDVFLKFINHMDDDFIFSLIKEFQERYQGSYDSLEEYGESFAENCGYLENIPECLRHHIDFERFAKDMEMSGDIFTFRKKRKEHVFSNY